MKKIAKKSLAMAMWTSDGDFLFYVAMRVTAMAMCEKSSDAWRWRCDGDAIGGPARSERFCKLCNTGEVENELHFILNCPTLSQVRDNFLNSLSGTNKAFSQLPPESKLRYLYFNEYLPQPELHTAANMLEALKVKRDALLS